MKNIHLLPISLLLLVTSAFAQQNSLSIGTTQINNKAVLWLVPNASGQGLLLPVVSTAVRNGMGLQAADRGMIVYDNTDNSVYLWNGTAWNNLAGGSVATFTGANGIIVTGNTISTDAVRPTTNATGDLSGTFANPQIANNAVTTAKIANDAVDNSKIANVNPSKLTQAAATSGQVLKWNGTAWAPADDLTAALTAGTGISIASNVITNTGLLTTSTAAGEVTGTFANLQIANGVVTDVKLADNAVTTAKLANNAVIASKIADGNVTTTKIADNAISTAKVQDANITTAKIADGAVTDAKLATGIAVNKLAPGANGQVLTVAAGQASWQPAPSGSVPTLSNGQILIGNGTVNTPTTLSGDATLAAGALTIANNAITNPKLANDAVTTAKILDANVTNAKLAPGIDAAKITVGTLPTARLNVGTTANQIVQLDGTGRLPVVDGSQLTNMPGDISAVVAGTGLTGGATTGSATLNVNTGTGANQIVQLDGTGRLPAVDGSQLTNLPGDISAVLAGTGLTGGATTGSATLNVNTGTGANQVPQLDASGKLNISTIPAGVNPNQIVQLDASGRLPAVDGSQLTGLAGGGDITGVTAGTGLTGGAASGDAILNVNVGTGANQIPQLDGTGKLLVGTIPSGTGANQVVQLDASSRLPAVDGSLLTNLPAGTETDPTVRAINGLVRSNGTTISAAVAGTDFLAPNGNGSALTNLNASNLSSGTLSSARIAAGDIDNTKLATGIDAAKISTGTLPGAVLPANVLLNSSAAGGELSGTLAALTINNNAVTTAKILDANVTNAKLATGIDAGKITAGTLPVAVGGTGATTLAANAVLLGNGTGAIASVTGGSPTNVLTLNGSNIPVWQPAPGGISNVSGTAPISVANGSTAPVVSISQANAGTPGFLSASDFSAFNAKQNALSFGNVTSGSSSLTVTGGTGAAVGGNVNLSLNTGTGPNQLVQLDGTGRLPAVDGSQLTGLPGGGDINGVDTPVGGGLIGGVASGTASLRLISGSATGQVLKWDNPSTSWVIGTDDVGSGSLPTLTDGQVIISVGANNPQGRILQQDVSVAPASGNVTVQGLRGIPISATAPGANQVLKFNAGTYSPAADNDNQNLSVGGTGTVATGESFPLDITNGTGVNIIEGTNVQIDRSGNNLTINTSGGGSPTGAATGDLAGTYPSPTINTASPTTGGNIITAVNAASAGTINTARLNSGVVLETENPVAGDVTGTFASGLQIGANAVTNAEINDVNASKINAGTFSVGAFGATNITTTGTVTATSFTGSAAGLTGFPTLNQNTTGNAATATTATALASGRTIGMTGDVNYTSPAFNGTSNITAGATVTGINGTSLAGLPTGILRNTTGTGVPTIATGADLPVMTNTVGGAVPTPPNNTTTFLRGDGTFAAPPGGGSVSTVSVATANGFNGSVATPGTTPAISIGTPLTGILRGNGTGLAVATAGTDYQAPITLTTTGTSGAATLVGNTLNIPNYAGTTYTAGTGLTLTTNTFSVNTAQNISTLSNLTTNGLIRTTGGTGALSIATAGTDYLTPTGIGSGLTSLNANNISSGTLAIANGGTNSTGTPTSGGVSYGTGTAYAFTSAGTSGQILQSNGAAAPTWVNSPTAVTAGNGLTRTVDNITLGGTLTSGTTIAMGGNNLSLTGTGNFGVGAVPVNRLDVEGGLAIGSGYAGTSTAPPNGAIIEGNVGIGTPSSAERLTVNGNAIFTGGNSRVTINKGTPADIASLIFNQGGTTLSNGWAEIGLTTDNKLHFKSNPTAGTFTDRMVIDNTTGNVGIGTPTPFSRLTVAGNVNISGNADIGSGLVFPSTIDLSIDDSDTGFEVPADGNLSIFTNDVERVRVSSIGNVGIGTSSPAGLLSVNSVGTTDPPGLYLSGFGATEGDIAVPTGEALQIGEWTGTSFTERMRINSAGNMGVGNASPSERLDVTGNIRFSGALMPNNNAGTAGQVLTSAGPGFPPTWSPAGGGGNMITTNNLSDLTNFATARANLGLGSVAYTWPASNGTGVLTNNGAGTLTWGPAGLTNPLTTTGDIIYGVGTTPTRLAGAAGFLRSTGAAAPAWSAVNLASTDVTGTLPIARGGTNVTAAPANGQVLIGNGAGYSLATLTQGSGVTITNGAGTITIASTGMTNPLTTNGDIIYGVGSTPTRLAAGTGFLRGGTVPSYSAVGLASADVTGTLPVANGGTNVATTPLNGQLLIGDGTGYSLATLTQGSGVTITNGAGTVTIAATGGATNLDGLTDVTISGTSAGQVLLHDGTEFRNRTLSGDISNIGPAGVVTIANNAITSVKIATDAVTTAKILDATITGADLAVGAIDLASTDVTGTLPIASGGTNSTTTPTNGGISYGTGTAYAFTAAGTSGQLLQSNGAAAPTWVNAPATVTASNGLTRTVNDVALGGTLTAATTIANAGFNLAITGTGNLGIGTTGPAQKLDIQNGDAIIRGIPGFGAVNDRARLYLGDNNNSIAAVNGSGLRFSAFNAADMVTFQQITGNVGLGTTTPANRLDVEGGLAVGATYSGTSAAPTNGAIIEGNVGIGNSAPGTDRLRVVDAGNVNQFSGTFSVFAQNFTQGIGIGYAGVQAVGTNANQDLSLNSKGTGNITMQVSGTSGNVGINTSGPLAKLHIAGAVANNLQAHLTQGVTDGGFKLTASNGVAGGVGTKQADFGMYYTGSGYGSGFSFYRGSGATDGAIGFNTNGFERMRIDNAGNVGMGGITNPGYNLHVANSVGITSGVDATLRISSGSISTAVSSQLVLQAGRGFFIAPNMSPEWTMGIYDNGELELRRRTDSSVSPASRFTFTNGSFLPSVDFSTSLGTSSNRWTTVFAVNGAINTSDVRLKENVKILDYGLSEVLKLRPVSFNWKTGIKYKKLGLIAQETEKIIPEVVTKPEEKDGYYGLMYSDLVPVLIKAAQELNTKIEALEKENSELKGANTKLKSEVTSMKEKQDTELAALKKQMDEVLRIVGAEAKKKN